MSKKFAKLLLLLAVIALVSSIFILNPTPITVFYGSGKSWTAPAALVLITVFCLGIVLSALVSLLLGFRFSYHVWREKKRDKLALDHLRLVGEAREQFVVGAYQNAIPVLKKILAQDGENIVARNMLSEAYEASGELGGALKILDEVRATQRENLELLFRAAMLNSKLGNTTAAYDNLALVLASQPNNLEALHRIGECASRLGRHAEAVLYQQKVVKLRPSGEEQIKLASLELAATSGIQNPSDRKTALEAVLKRHRDFPPALEALARIEREDANLEGATKILTKAYRESKDPRALEELSAMWLEAKNPSRAVAAVNNAVTANPKEVSPQGELFLLALMRRLGMHEEAKRACAAFLSRSSLTDDERKQGRYFDAVIAAREGRTSAALTTLEELLRREPWNVYAGSAEEESPTHRPLLLEERTQPSPTLSTP